ncbi:DUF188 domain-containing protein [Alkalicoccus urumqiensis]|nr:DUF188 domain-containing protein [Alkalicoccus urumqiensis]
MKKILLDADASPVTKLVLSHCEAMSIPLTVVHSRDHVPRDGWPDWVDVHIVEAGPDAADFQLLAECRRGDLVITGDIGLAALCIGRGAEVLQFKGDRIRPEELDMLLALRYETQKARRRGKYGRGPSARSRDDDDRFARMLQTLTEAWSKGDGDV